MFLRRLEWAVAAGAAGWAAVRLAGADRAGWGEAWSVPLLSFTPQVASAACGAALLMRGRGSSAVTGLAGAALAAAVVPRAVPGRRAGTGGRPGTGGPAAAGGPVLRVLTVNLLHGHAEPAAVVGLVRDTAADVLFIQEVTGDSAAGLGRHGIDDLLPHRVIDPAVRDTAIYARRPLTGEPGAAGELGWARRPGGWHTARQGPCWSAARLEPAPGRFVRLVCVHTQPPLPPWQAGGTAAWRAGLAGLPGPGEIPVIMAGDFNATLDHAQFRRLLGRGYTDAAAQAGLGLVPTWGLEPGGRPPLLTIDHVLTDSRGTARNASVHPVAGTDHRALYAEIRLSA
jgi:endonuclease/exonuclease/phosphatase (EEP) superfamily protein YafD